MSGDDDTGFIADETAAFRNRTEKVSSALTSPGDNRVKEWFLLTGSRLTVTGVLLVLVFVSLFGLALLKPLQLHDMLNETNAVKTLFSSLLSGAILLVSIVVSINSIVLSQEITDIQDQQERITATIDYRRQIEEYIHEDVTPSRPSEFLITVMYAISRQMESLVQVAEDSTDDYFIARVDEFAEQVEQDIQQTRQTLESARVGSFAVLLAGLNYNYSGQLQAARRLKRTFDDELDADEQETIGQLIGTLKQIATGRQHFKSLYYKREFAHLSTVLLYVSLPVIVFTSYVILALDARLLPDVQILGISPYLISIIFAYSIALAPFVVLTAYVVRAAAISLRTLSEGPFILQQGEEIDVLELESAGVSRDWGLIGGEDKE